LPETNLLPGQHWAQRRGSQIWRSDAVAQLLQPCDASEPAHDRPDVVMDLVNAAQMRATAQALIMMLLIGSSLSSVPFPSERRAARSGRRHRGFP